jgi:hypothetical protein
MKVYLSSYRNHWISPYTILEWLYRREVDSHDPTIVKWANRLEPFCVFLQKILDKIHPYINYVKIDYYDTWNTDRTLALVIHPLLVQLQKAKHGSPNVDDEDVPEELRSNSAPPKEKEWDTDDNHHKRWDWVLNEMIWTFAQILDEDADRQFHSGEHDIRMEEVEINGEKLYQMVRGPNDTHKFDREGYDAWNERQKNGLRLFGKYYRGLWD